MRPPSNQEIAKMFSEMATLYEMENVQFKPRAYENASESIAHLDREVVDIYNELGRRGLRQIPSVGEGIAHHLEALIKTGTFSEYKKYKKKIPVNLEELSGVSGLGPKMIKALYVKLKIKNLADLEKAAALHKIQQLPHFGPTMEEKIVKNINFLKKNVGRFLLGELETLVRNMEKRLKKITGVGHVTTAGSFRRRQETIGDIDILVTSTRPDKVMKTFVAMPEVADVLAKGQSKTMVKLTSGIQADVRVVPEKSYGAALQYFTGSKEHNILLRKLALAKKFKLNEYGVWRGKKLIAGRTEEEVYQSLGLAYMEPELRTATGEIEAARQEFKGQKPGLPKIVPYGCVRGDLQIQTDWTDGQNSLNEMVKAAQKAGLEYIAITDHTKSLAMTGGLDERKLLRQGKVIDKMNAKFRKQGTKFKILKSAEVNILKDGKLDIDDKTLKTLDLVSVAIHSHFNLSEAEQTERMIRAIKHPLVNIVFHPTGRVLGRREAYALNMDKVIRAAKQYGVILEINAHPDRLDLKDTHIRQAMEAGVKFVVDSDAHSIYHFGFYDFGFSQARRGWATKKDILNTLSCEEFLQAVKKLKHK